MGVVFDDDFSVASSFIEYKREPFVIGDLILAFKILFFFLGIAVDDFRILLFIARCVVVDVGWQYKAVADVGIVKVLQLHPALNILHDILCRLDRLITEKQEVMLIFTKTTLSNKHKQILIS